MKAWLDQKFADWRGADRAKDLIDFSKYLGIEYGTLNNWMNGTRNPKKENVAKLSEKLGLEAYDVAGFARPGIEGTEPYMVSKFALGWKMFPPDLQRDYEEFFASATSEEVVELFKDVIKTRLSRGKQVASDADDEHDEEPASPQKKSGRKQARLSRRVDGA
jgi:transcriptional regulator with XRE-family HTH domain